MAALVLAGTMVAAGGSSALAQDAAGGERTTAFDAVVACQAITDAAERLACFDRTVTAMETARRERQIIVMDRETVRETRRGLFGLQLPAIRIFGDRDDDTPESEAVDRIETTIARASQNASGKWVFVLADGARWEQIDTRRITTPRNGTTIVIRRAAMGSFLANVGGQIAIRVRRIN